MPAPLDAAFTTFKTLLRRIGRIPLGLFLLWVSTLWWGERRVFDQSAASCEWQRWESWPLDASPHHVLLIADPQLVDPHTYPGRPWPLSALTVWITDLYMRRSYNYLLDHLKPDTTLFLGDLFDGGREWATEGYESRDVIYKKYGTNFWLREYNRFMDLFVTGWYKHDLHQIPSNEGRRIIASLPGNHDLGFGQGINPLVRDRFDAHFGPLNRVDVLGNHTFVSLDTVSLSAMDAVDPVTGSSGAGDGTAVADKHREIWKPVESFLEHARVLRAKAVQKRYEHLDSGRIVPRSRQEKAAVSSSSFPTIVLSHVPLFRNGDVTCGPLRERGSAIPLAAGYQYQNVLTPAISADIVKHLDAEQIAMIYSGDDHDYCEIQHSEFTGSIREITVKSVSMAMGVLRPGVQLVSLWNPIDMDEIAHDQTKSTTPKGTVQNKLCLLPFQGGIFMRYAALFVFTLIILAIRALRYNPQDYVHELRGASSTPSDRDNPLLPLTHRSSSPPPASPPAKHSNSSSTSSSTPARSRNANSKIGGYGNLPSSSRSGSPLKPVPDDTADYFTSPSMTTSKSKHKAPSMGRFSDVKMLLLRLSCRSPSRQGEFLRSFCLVGGPVLSLYLWLVWNG